LGPKERKSQETGENCIVRSFTVITARQIGPPIIITMKLLRMGWAGHVARMNGKEKY
jgi:hypothetical protein